MNEQELKDKAYAESVSALQQKLTTGAINEGMYEEQYENLRSSWVVNNTKDKVNLFM